MHLGGVSLGGIARGAQYDGSVLQIGKSFATLNRAYASQQSGKKLTVAQKAALDNADSIERAYNNMNRQQHPAAPRQRKKVNITRKARAAPAARAPRRPHVSHAKMVKAEYPALTANEVKRVVKRRQTTARRADNSLLLDKRFKRGLKSKDVDLIQPLSARRGVNTDQTLSDLLAVYGYGDLDLPLGAEGYDGEIIQAGARRRRVSRKPRIRGAGNLDLPLGVEGYDGEIIQAGARRRHVGRPRKSHM